jgi:hypothetical protein
MQGWVSFHRQIMKWEWYTDPNTFRLFFHLVLNANHEKGRWKGNNIERGQLITSSDKLATQLELSRQQIRTALKKLEDTNEITIKSTNKFTLVTIEKYSFYQGGGEEATNNPTNEQPSNNHQITTNNNDNNVNNDNNKDILSHFESCWKLYPNKKGKDKITLTDKKELFKFSQDQISKAINNLKTDYPDKQYQMHGRRFFKGDFKDYLDGTWEKTQSNVDNKNKFNNFNQREHKDLNGKFGMKG